MPMFHIRVVNSDFESCNELDASSPDDAKKHALRAALQIGVDEVCNGNPFFGAEVRVEFNGNVETRFVVGMGQSPLK